VKAEFSAPKDGGGEDPALALNPFWLSSDPTRAEVSSSPSPGSSLGTITGKAPGGTKVFIYAGGPSATGMVDVTVKATCP
jgi:hypothetical protein